MLSRRPSPLHAAWPLIVGLLLLFGLVGSAPAQSTGEPEAIDPPARVGTVSLLAGPVTMVDLSNGSREEALLNWPVTGGWRIETGRGGRAEVRVGSTALRLDDETTVDFVRLDDHFMQIAVLRGSLALRLRNPEILNEIEVLTQRERIVFEQAGSYRIDVDRSPATTALTAFSGRARISGAGSSFEVAAGQRGEITAAPTFRVQLLGATADRFDEWVAARDAREEAVRSAGYVSRETPGVELLDQYGEWRAVPEYGAVWFPSAVPATWAPYRFGRWVWISPWGWTWIDEAPWGFAPMHYGRWAVIGGVWGWVPGVVVARPVFAPALVAWYSTPGVSVSVGAPVGWFPLGPREPFVPAYRHSPRYLSVVNVQNVPNVERVTIVQTPRYVNRQPDRSTWVPDDRFGRPEPVQRGQRPPPSEWRQYIARPQPPANVPNTKRRQAVEGGAPPGAPADARTVAPPALVTPRPGGAPARPPEPARAVETQRAQPAYPLPTRPEPPAARGRPPAPSRPAEPRAPEASRAVEAPRTAPVAPAPSRPAEPRAPEASRAVEAPRAAPVAPPVQRPAAPAARGEPSATDERRYAPRAPMTSPSPPMPARESPPARAVPPPMHQPLPETMSPPGRGGPTPQPRDGAHRVPAVPPSPAPQVAPESAPPAVRGSGPPQQPGRSAPPPREARTGDRPDSGPVSAPGYPQSR